MKLFLSIGQDKLPQLWLWDSPSNEKCKRLLMNMLGKYEIREGSVECSSYVGPLVEAGLLGWSAFSAFHSHPLIIHNYIQTQWCVLAKMLPAVMDWAEENWGIDDKLCTELKDKTADMWVQQGVFTFYLFIYIYTVDRGVGVSQNCHILSLVNTGTLKILRIYVHTIIILTEILKHCSKRESIYIGKSQ